MNKLSEDTNTFLGELFVTEKTEQRFIQDFMDYFSKDVLVKYPNTNNAGAVYYDKVIVGDREIPVSFVMVIGESDSRKTEFQNIVVDLPEFF